MNMHMATPEIATTQQTTNGRPPARTALQATTTPTNTVDPRLIIYHRLQVSIEFVTAARGIVNINERAVNGLNYMAHSCNSDPHMIRIQVTCTFGTRIFGVWRHGRRALNSKVVCTTTGRVGSDGHSARLYTQPSSPGLTGVTLGPRSPLGATPTGCHTIVTDC
jgi:hypothetical protein